MGVLKLGRGDAPKRALKKEASCVSICSSEVPMSAPKVPMAAPKDTDPEMIIDDSDEDSLSTSKETTVINPKKGGQKERATVTDNKLVFHFHVICFSYVCFVRSIRS